MKLVKKLLRLLPFILFGFYYLFIILFKQYELVDLISTNGYTQFIFNNIMYVGTLCNQHMVNFLSSFHLMDFADNLVSFFSGGDLFYEDLSFLCQVVIFIPFYELFLSLIFLFFDVLNWFLSLGRNLLKKGGKYDD